MARQRLFDYDEARQRRDAGEKILAIAVSYGVSYEAVWRATLSPDARRRLDQRRRERYFRTNCDRCGGVCTHNPHDHRQGHRVGQAVLCRSCSGDRQAEEAVARRVNAGLVRCVRCGEYKPLDAYRPQKPRPYLPASWCRSCETEDRAARRAARPDLEAAAVARARHRRQQKRGTYAA